MYHPFEGDVKHCTDAVFSQSCTKEKVELLFIGLLFLVVEWLAIIDQARHSSLSITMPSDYTTPPHHLQRDATYVLNEPHHGRYRANLWKSTDTTFNQQKEKPFNKILLEKRY